MTFYLFFTWQSFFVFLLFGFECFGESCNELRLETLRTQIASLQLLT